MFIFFGRVNHDNLHLFFESGTTWNNNSIHRADVRKVVEVPVTKQVHLPMVETVQKQVEVPQARGKAVRSPWFLSAT